MVDEPTWRRPIVRLTAGESSWRTTSHLGERWLEIIIEARIRRLSVSFCASTSIFCFFFNKSLPCRFNKRTFQAAFFHAAVDIPTRAEIEALMLNHGPSTGQLGPATTR